MKIILNKLMNKYLSKRADIDLSKFYTKGEVDEGWIDTLKVFINKNMNLLNDIKLLKKFIYKDFNKMKLREYDLSNFVFSYEHAIIDKISDIEFINCKLDNCIFDGIEIRSCNFIKSEGFVIQNCRIYGGEVSSCKRFNIKDNDLFGVKFKELDLIANKIMDNLTDNTVVFQKCKFNIKMLMNNRFQLEWLNIPMSSFDNEIDFSGSNVEIYINFIEKIHSGNNYIIANQDTLNLLLDMRNKLGKETKQRIEKHVIKGTNNNNERIEEIFFNRNQLKLVNFNYCNFFKSSFFNNKIMNSKFENCIFYSIMSGSDFINTKFNGSRFTEGTIADSNFLNCDLSRCIFSSAIRIKDCSFKGSNLCGTVFDEKIRNEMSADFSGCQRLERDHEIVGYHKVYDGAGKIILVKN